MANRRAPAQTLDDFLSIPAGEWELGEIIKFLPQLVAAHNDLRKQFESKEKEIDTVMHMNRALQVKLDSIKSTMAQYAGQISHEAGRLMALKKRDDDLIKYIDQNIDKTDKPN
ncbi:hypothetical protein WR25_13535 [Diploscapter pachys]|uniref:Uncharacterized protein n=1 Tax=Diploscapter pachys TaxID=2018661 RepID=A0A2A2JD30_9BILA|nr:hypothetical protein WR25_13535 [Diploscapter pachys]